MIQNIFKTLERLGFGSQTRAISAQFSNPRLNADVFVQRVDGNSGLNEDNSYELLCLSTNAHLELKQFMGCQVGLDVVTDMGRLKRLTGVIVSVIQGCSDGALTVYKLQLQSGLALLEKRRNSRVFMNKTVVEIVQILFKEWQQRSPLFASSLSLDLSGLTQDYDVLPFIMQHNQTDLEFVKYLLKKHSINFYIDEAQTFVTHNSEPIQAQKLRLIDDNRRFEALQRRSIRFHRSDAAERFDTITQFSAERSLQPTSVHIQRWQPDALEQEDGAGSVLSWHKHSERYDNESLALEDAWHISPAWMQDLNGEDGATRSSHHQIDKLNQNLSKQHNLNAKYFTAHSTVRDAAVGYWFTFEGHAEIDEHKGSDREFLILNQHFYNQNNLPKDIQKQVENLLTQSRWQDQMIEEQDQRQGNTLTLVRRNIAVVPQYHPEKDKPTVHVQRAKVVGLEGEQIHVDEWGRIKVRFLFSREEDNTHDGGAGSNNTDTDSAWVDVLTPWAGEGYGARFLPRVGEVVVVDFFDGNPDRPFVIGRLHEAERMPTQFDQKGKLPDTKKLSGIRSQEIDGNGFNQLRFDDTTGQISTQLQSSHGVSQLNLGNLSHPKENETSEGRGEGFELRTDAWGTLRANKGLMITTEPAHNAIGHQLDRKQLQADIEKTKKTNDTLKKLAKGHQTTEPDLTLQEQTIEQLPQWNESEETPYMVLNSKDSIIANTQNGIVFQAKENIDISSSGHTQIFSNKGFFANVMDKISLFAKSTGIKIKAGAGKVEIEAQSDEMKIASQKKMHVYAIEDLVKIESGKAVVLTSGGGSYIKLEGNNIDIVCAGELSLKGNRVSIHQGARLQQELPKMPEMQMDYDQQFVVRNRAGKAMPNVKYKIETDDRKVITGVTDSEGRTQKLDALVMGKSKLTILDHK